MGGLGQQAGKFFIKQISQQQASPRLYSLAGEMNQLAQMVKQALAARPRRKIDKGRKIDMGSMANLM
jgi:hypothetical protein